ncbi:MAG: hypothetical protein V4506_18150 [Bacteroidota bacterium]
MENTTSIEQQCREMAAILGLKEAVSEHVLRAAVLDPTYAHNLLVCKDDPGFLSHLLGNPPKPAVTDNTEPISTGVLLNRAADSLMRWVKTGFSRVSEATYQKRLSACSTCPHLIEPPEKQRSLYKVAGADENEKSVCGVCRCVVKVKAFRTSDTCPDADPLNPGFNRWNEALQPQN